MIGYGGRCLEAKVGGVYPACKKYSGRERMECSSSCNVDMYGGEDFCGSARGVAREQDATAAVDLEERI